MNFRDRWKPLSEDAICLSSPILEKCHQSKGLAEEDFSSHHLCVVPCRRYPLSINLQFKGQTEMPLPLSERNHPS
uniref:Uncharacterized protein n=1 Tax=Nelumbo nucifera TaxID=4432 RepID=A0A822YUU5_NELNU|nr:TPA_asm: hypothetical protein HUJ06_011869 [Nelumbo nucifera]